MKIIAKYLLVPVALLVGAFAQPAVGQVYSLCIVGYVNAPIAAGYTFLASPLDQPGSNTLSHVIYGWPEVPLGTAIHLWDITNQTWSPPAVYMGEASGWAPDYEVPPGKAFVVSSTIAWTNTFIGQLFGGTNWDYVAESNKFSLVARPFPVATNLASFAWPDPFFVSTFPWVDGENVYRFDPATQRYADAHTCFDAYGWYDPAGTADTNGPIIRIAESFFVQNRGQATNWLHMGNCGATLPQGMLAAADSPAPRISRIRVRGGVATLEVNKPNGGYNVEWSSDGLVWLVLAAGRTNSTWAGPVPPGARGYFRLIQP